MKNSPFSYPIYWLVSSYPYWLVVPSENYEFVSWDDYSRSMGK